MANDTGFWTWPIDGAAEQTRARRLMIGASALYWLGALLLLAQTVFALSVHVATAGVALVLLGVAGSVGVLGKVVLTRSRLPG